MPRPALSVKARIAGTCALLLAVTLAGVATVVVQSTGDSARRAAEQLTARTAEQQAALVDAELQTALGTARDLGATLSALRTDGASRAEADRVLKEVLAGHEGYLGIWTGWEPQAWDGRDASFAGRPGHDATGRYVPYWYRDGEAIAHDALTGYAEDGAGDYYLVPQRTGKEKVVDPYRYEIAGEQVLITSVGVPVRDGQRVAGVAGLDIALSTIQEQVGAIRVYGTGRATLVSTGGLVVAGPDAEQVGEQASGALKALAADAADGTVASTVDSAAGEVLRVATPLELGAADTWTLVVDVPLSAVLADAHALRRTIVLISLLALVVAGGLSLLAARRLVRPVDVLRERLEQISEGDGDLTQRVDETAQDEIGALGRAFNRFVEKVAGTVREITGTAGELTAAATSLESVAHRLAAGTEATAEGTARLAAASAQVDAGVQTVATATEEMGATAREIAAGAASASRMAADGVAAATAAGSTVAALGSSSAEIGDVVRVITSIAEQTNLLALNATIEAARAGEAGKGFAVVANEVKDLAQETARATGDITAKVEALQSASERAGEALARITQAIGSVDETQTSIATAVEEQAATVQSLAQTVTQAADGTAAMAAGIADVDGLAAGTSTAATETGAAARDLQRLADRLGTLVGDFRC